MNRLKFVFLSFLFAVILFAQTLIILPACGTPGNGTSITVTNDVLDLAPNSFWTYTITELNPPKNRKPFTASFALSVEGEDTYSFGGLRSGAYRVVETSPNVERPFGYSASMIIESNQNNDIQVVSGFEVVVNITSSEGKKVTFTTNAMPAFAYSGFSLPPPPQSYSIPPLDLQNRCTG